MIKAGKNVASYKADALWARHAIIPVAEGLRDEKARENGLPVKLLVDPCLDDVFFCSLGRWCWL